MPETSPASVAARTDRSSRSYATYSAYISDYSDEVAVSTLICLIHQASYLLDQQLRQLERAFVEEGGFTERLHRVRSQARNRPPDASGSS